MISKAMCITTLVHFYVGKVSLNKLIHNLMRHLQHRIIIIKPILTKT